MARERATDTETLVDAAAGVIRLKGYHNTTIDDIAAAVGISRPTVYKYISSKQWLLDRMIEMLAQDLDERLENLLEQESDPAKRLRAVIAANVSAAVDNRTIYAIVFSEQAELSADGRTQFTKWAHEVTIHFKRLLDDCDVSPTVDTWVASNLILSMITTLYRWYDPTGPMSPNDLTDQVISLLGAAIPQVPD